MQLHCMHISRRHRQGYTHRKERTLNRRQNNRSLLPNHQGTRNAVPLILLDISPWLATTTIIREHQTQSKENSTKLRQDTKQQVKSIFETYLRANRGVYPIVRTHEANANNVTISIPPITLSVRDNPMLHHGISHQRTLFAYCIRELNFCPTQPSGGV